MPNFFYTQALQVLQESADWESLDLRAALLDNTSTAGSQEDVTSLSAFSTLGEVSGTGYARQALAGLTVTLSTADDAIRFTANHLSYGGIAVGDIAAILIYVHDALGDGESTPFLFLDNSFTVTAAAPAAIGDDKIYVDPIPNRILAGSVLEFPGPSLATLTGTANAGDRQLNVNELEDPVTLAAAAIHQTQGFPIPTNGGPLTITLPSNLLEVLAV